MGTAQKKQYLFVGSQPVLARTISCFNQNEKIDEIILVIPEEDLKYCESEILSFVSADKPVHLVSGGNERYDSVYNGLVKAQILAAEDKDNMVLVHDGVRPFINQDLICESLERAIEHGACIPGVKVSDTIKHITKNGFVSATLDRKSLFTVQTPQVFKMSLLIEAFHHAKNTGFTGTDDASYVEHFGHPVYICTGSKINIKITTLDDLTLAEQILKQIV